MIFDFLIATLSVTAVLIIWFQTHVVLEYGQLLGLGKYLGINLWMEKKKEAPTLQYLQWLISTYGVVPVGASIPVRFGSFVIRMLGCQYCFGFWLSLVAAILSGHWQWTLAIYSAALLLMKVRP